MNPYGGPFSNTGDQITAWLATSIILATGSATLSKLMPAGLKKAERCCMATASGILLVCGLLVANLLCGWILLIELHIKSPIWLVWELGYIVSVISIFRVLPVMALGIVCWAVVGKWRGGYDSKVLWTSAACVPAIGLNGLIAFLMGR